MDKLTQRIVEALKSKDGSKHFPIRVDSVVRNEEGRKPVVRTISWQVNVSQPTVQTFSLRYDEYGTVSVYCSSEVIVNLSEISDEKWIINFVHVGGGNPDEDVEVVIKQVNQILSREERFLIGTFIERWPHLSDCMNVWFELGLIVKAAVFETVEAAAFA